MLRTRWILLLGYVLLSLGVLVGALVSPAFRAFSYAPLRELFLPPSDPIVVTVYYSTEKEAWLQEVIEDFYDTRPMLQGHPVQLELSKMGSREMYLAVLEGEQPDLISPASSLQIALLQDLSRSKFGYAVVNPLDESMCRPVLRTPLVLVAWKERAEVLFGASDNVDLWTRIHDALNDPQGWAAYGHPEWGYVKYAQTNPLKSNSGFMAILLQTYDYLGKTSGLTEQDILSSPEYQQWFLEFQQAVPEFGDSTGTYMRDIIAYGPSKHDMVAVYEATAIEQMENAVGRYGELRVYYPPSTVMSDHPFCILDADWVSPEEEKAGRMFVDFMLEEGQEKALLGYGFRPIDRGIALDQRGSPFIRYEQNGVRVDLPPEVALPAGNVLDTLLEFWRRNIQP
ncbi:MAG: substrate-binding domain-containing protein [Chloroflexia bacterium]|nr:substrate-binding domain-containing protein [Chloroflexia bacterium]